MNTRGRVAVFQGVLTVAPEQQPCGVQVVERVGLVPFSFQFITRLAAVFA